MTRTEHDKRDPAQARRRVRKDSGDAFIPDPGAGAAHTDDTLAENLAEEYLESATSGEERGEEAMNELVSEEIGGPFIELSSAIEDDELPRYTREPGRRKSRKKPRVS